MKLKVTGITFYLWDELSVTLKKKSFKKFKSFERDTSFKEELMDRYPLASAVLDFLFRKLSLFKPYALFLD